MTDPDDEDVLRRHFIAVATGEYDDEQAFGALAVDEEVAQFEGWLCAPELGDRAFKRAGLDRNPTKAKIEDALIPESGWTPQDAVAVYVTGHGFDDSERHWIALKKTIREPKLRPNTAVETYDLVSSLVHEDVDHLLVIIDLCYAGKALGPLVALEIDWKPTWLLLASAPHDAEAGVGVLAGAVGRFLAEARGSRKYNHAKYFSATEFINALCERLPESQWPVPLQPRFTYGRANLCLPNPGWLPTPAVGPAIRAEELVAHWSPRARGVAHDAEPGWYFAGRGSAMNRVLEFVAAEPGCLLVTGQAGSGKSAVLSRLVTLADAAFAERYADRVAAIAPESRPNIGTVDAAVLATGKLANQVLGQICAAVGARRADRGEVVPGVAELLEDWQEWLGTHERVVTVVVDALDEAESPLAVVEKVLAKLNPPDGPRRVRLLVSVRSLGGEPSVQRTDPGATGASTILADAVQTMLGAERLNLDRPPYADEGAVAGLVRSILVETDGSPYRSASEETLDQIVGQITRQAGLSYLLARAAAASLAGREEMVEPSDQQWLAELRGGVIGIVRGEIARKATKPGGRQRTVQLLRALAFGHGAGIPWAGVWAQAATAIAQTANYGDADIEDLLGSMLVGYLATDREDGITTYRIADATIRQALRDQWWLLAGDEPPAEPDPIAEFEARIAEALAPRRTRARTWGGPLVPEYVRRHLVEHAAAGEVLTPEIVPESFLPHIDPNRLREADPSASALPLSQTVRRTAHRWDWHRPRFNAAALRMYGALHGMPLAEAAFDDDWVVRWASPSSDVSEILGRHQHAASVATVSVEGRTIAVTGGPDGLRAWDLTGASRTGALVAGVPRNVTALAVVTPPGRGPLVLVASGDADGVWAVGLTADQPTVRLAIALAGRPCALAAMATADGLTAVTGDRLGRVAIWDLSAGVLRAEAVEGHSGPITGVAVLAALTQEAPTQEAGASAVAVTAGDDGTVRMWDLATARPVGSPMTGHRGPVSSLTMAALDGRPVAITGGFDETVRLWDLLDQRQRGTALEGHDGAVWGVSAVTLADGRTRVVSCAEDPALRIWDLETLTLQDDSMKSHGRPIAALATAQLDAARQIAVSAGRDGVIRTWPLTSRPSSARFPSGEPEKVKRDRISSLATGRRPDGNTFVVIGGAADDAAVRALDGAERPEVLLRGHTKPVSVVRTAVCAGGSTVVVTAAWDGTMRLWNPVDGQQIGREASGHEGAVLAMDVAVSAGGRLLAVSGGLDGKIRFWDLEQRSVLDSFSVRRGWVTAVAIGRSEEGRAVAVTGTKDGWLRAWDLESREPLGAWTKGHRAQVRALATAVLDGRIVAVSGGGDGDAAVRVWDVDQMRPIGRRMTGHVGQVTALATGTLDNGRAVALSGDTEAVRVLDLSLCVPIGVELPTPGPVSALALQSWSSTLRAVAGGNDFLAVADHRSFVAETAVAA